MTELPLSEELKLRTRKPHLELEKALALQMRSMKSVSDYTKLLQIFYSYFGSLEDSIDKYIGSAELPDHLQRRKSESLAADIRALGGDLTEKASSAEIPEIADHLQAFGALYVMEGSTLGGKIISQMIAKQLGIKDKGLSFFQSYGEDLSSMWLSFKQTLDQQADTPAERERVIAAAYDTFYQFKILFDRKSDSLG